MNQDTNHPATYDAAGIAEWLRFIQTGRPNGTGSRLMVAPRSTVYIGVDILPCGTVRLAMNVDRWKSYPTVEAAAVVAARACADAQFAMAVEARTLRARKAMAAREELLRDLLAAARALVPDYQGPAERVMCDAFDEALNKIDGRYPHLKSRPSGGYKPATVRAAELLRRMDEVGL